MLASNDFTLDIIKSSFTRYIFSDGNLTNLGFTINVYLRIYGNLLQF